MFYAAVTYNDNSTCIMQSTNQERLKEIMMTYSCTMKHIKVIGLFTRNAKQYAKIVEGKYFDL